MKDQEKKVVLTAKVSEQAANGWKKFCRDNGVTLTAMIEVAGLDLGNEESPPSVPTRIKMLEKARQIDMNRRIRSR